MPNIYHNEKVIGQIGHQVRDGKGRFAKGKRVFKKVLVSVICLGIAFIIGSYANAQTIYSVREKIVEVKRTAPVLDRISKCENGGSHYDKNGQVAINKTQDIGKYQINVPIWGKKATEMGLDLSKESDNKIFAEYLYENFGSEPWVHSKKCWSK